MATHILALKKTVSLMRYMEPDSKAQAQQRADQIRAFQAEVARLEAEGVMQLSADQQGAIHTYHDDLLAGFSQTFDIDRRPDRQTRYEWPTGVMGVTWWPIVT